MSDTAWEAIFEHYRIYQHPFKESPFLLTASQIKAATQHLGGRTADREPRLLCKHDTRESRPIVFKENGLFILPIKNGEYIILQGEGYVDIPPIPTTIALYRPQLAFRLDTIKVGDSEMQHLDYAFASSLIKTFAGDNSLVLTIRGRKYTPRFSFYAAGHFITAEGVQTEVDAGYEGRDQLLLVEAKNRSASNTIIRQLYYPYRQWSSYTHKPVQTLFFEKSIEGKDTLYKFWRFVFPQQNNYNSIELTDARQYKIIETE